MKLLTKALLAQFPKLYATEKTPAEEKKVIAKFFHVFSNWTWYAVEYDPTERRFFGLVDGHKKEWGYFTLDELESVKIHGLGIERDLYFGQPLIKDISGLL